jgi:hypothetical protein
MSSVLVLNDREAPTPSAVDYARRYAAARREAAQMGTAARAKLHDVYTRAGESAARVVGDSLERGLSSLTVERWRVLAAKLFDAADSVASGTESVTRALISDAGSLFPEVDAEFVLSAARFAGASKITKQGLGRIVSGINSRVVESLTTRLWSDGYTFSDRVWGGEGVGVRGDWLERIKMTVAAGIAQGRDPVKIAKDIQAYTADGKVALGQRWGSLERGTSEFSKRIPGRLDWRAQRLVRSELSASLQDSAVLAGESNPAGDGEYDWVLSLGRLHWACECESLAASGPYKADAVPTYPHSNCGCTIRPHLREMAGFLSDLKSWARGGSVDYLDAWYEGTYKAAA